ncbi:TrbI/VirB10 family protein [Edaphobacter aggregans]|uniref:TrbI/VirB10 family protein n=1 Tax=Edaphobacter aggregans TaxID=570835 RepID=UPI00068E04F3|nr:TrbI/VirB10 family protein [Edaphobacter aggregans]
MIDQTFASPAPQEPELRKKSFDPKGVMQKNAKAMMFVGVAALVFLALIFSAKSKTPSDHQGAQRNAPQPLVQDNTENNVAAMKSHVAGQQQALEQAVAVDPAMAVATPAQRAAVQAYNANGQVTPCLPGQPCMQPPQYGYAQQGGVAQPSPEEQASQQLAAKERERSYESRFSSNIAYTRPAEPGTPSPQPQTISPSGYTPANVPQNAQPPTSLVSSRTAGEAPISPVGQNSIKRGPEVNIDSASGQPYVVFEGTTIDTVLMNRLDGDAVGSVKVLVSNPVYSHDRQHVLIPEGTIVLGEAKKIGSVGFGQQRRMSVAFHRLLMPDGYSVDLDQFHGLDQIGEEGLKDKVNNHYLQIFGTSIALGVIAGAAQATQGGGVYAGSGAQIYTNGAAASVSQSATTILDRYMQIPPTITTREGHRVKVYITQDMLLPAYENHTIPGSF